MLKAQNISKSYGKLQVLEDINLEVKRNEIAAIVGKSGSGKSTLLHILGTLDEADQGDIWIENTLVNHLKERDLARFRNEHIGFIFQFHHLLAEFNAIENVCLPALISGNSKIESQAKAAELLEYLELGDRLHHKPGQLSGGEQQRVAIARALINKPAIVFADEPTGNLDDSTSENFFKLLVRMRNDFDQTFVIVTHSRDIADKCDRTLILSHRKLRSNGRESE